MNTQIKFNKFNVTNGEIKARVSYSLDGRIDGKLCVCIDAKDYNRNLGNLFKESYINNSDSMSDYFETGTVYLLEVHPLYKIAREHVEKIRSK